jgi:predicted phage terminase large subunit-like protein
MSNTKKLSLRQLTGYERDELPKGLTLERLLKFCAQESFLAFCLALKPGFLPTKFHTMLSNELQRVFESVNAGNDEREIVEVQPQIGKSTECSELFPAWILGMMPMWPIICASYSSTLAEQKSQSCRDMVISPVYKMIFPKTELHPDVASKEYWKTTLGGSYRAAGVGAGLTGMSGKIMIEDDLIKDMADAMSETIRESTWDWHQTVLMTRKQSRSGILLVNTRWHLQDVAGKLEAKQRSDMAAGLPEGTYDIWKRLSFPAFAEDDEYMNGVLFRRKGEVLCPERFTYNDMVKTRNSMDVYKFAALYMQNPITAESAAFKQGWFKYFEDKDITALRLTYMTFVDLAISQNKRADDTVVFTVGHDRNTGKVYLMDYTAGKMDPLQTIDAMFDHFDRFRSKFWIESVGYQAALRYFVVEEQRRRRVFFNIEELKHAKTSKANRIEALIPLYKAGMIYHREHMKEYEAQLLSFPFGAHDDMIDCASFFPEVADATTIEVTQKEADKLKKQARERFDPFSPFDSV